MTAAADEFKPTPDELLAHAERSERARGRLKVFLGYAAGVGKTYAMLEAAHERLREGTDVIVAYVETHGRAETEELLTGLEVTPRASLEYRETTFQEMDLEAVLVRAPRLALVDELAHTNAPGSRHAKRYQDVEELLRAGIDVYTTVNVQHIQSLNDVVAQVTEVTVRETVPDRVIEEAEEIELVDLPPDELLDRLRAGKVYVPDQAARAAQLFFRKGNLAALRELALRLAAQRADEDMRAYMRLRSIPGPWPVTERLLVCVGPGPMGHRLVRAAKRLATDLKAEWLAVHVETPRTLELPDEDRDSAASALRLAEELGARVVTLTGQTVAAAVVDYCRRANVTKIVIGKPLARRWRDVIFGSPVDRIIRQSGSIDVYVIPTAAERRASSAPGQRALAPAWPYAVSLGMVVAATIAGWFLHRVIQPTNLVMLYLAMVLVAALYLGRGPAVVASVAGVLAFDFFLVDPKLTLVVSDTQYILTFVGLLATGLITGTLVSQVRAQVQSARRRTAHMAGLYDLAKDLSAAMGPDHLAQTLAARASEVVEAQVSVLVPRGDGLVCIASTDSSALTERDKAVATWALLHRQRAGRGTDTLPTSDGLCVPLVTGETARGVMWVRTSPGQELTRGQRRLLDGFAQLAALAFERVVLHEQARKLELLGEAERIQSALLQSVSHELRTPLASITGVLSALAGAGEGPGTQAGLTPEARRELLETARDEADRLNRLVENLLDMTRLESGLLRLRVEPSDVQDLIGSALNQVSARLRDRQVTVTVAPDLALVPMDFVLMVQVLANLLDNAARYSPRDSAVEVAADEAGGRVRVAVSDRGYGIAPGERARVFGKFYRVPGVGDGGGTGLGLAIAKAIVEAHGGSVRADGRPGGGTTMIVELPLGDTEASGEAT